jgi:hypothetical protein
MRGSWKREGDTLSWRVGEQDIWKLVFDARIGNKLHFHPLSLPGGPPLTQARPDDHPWHYGLWLSWKFINGANYWEERGENNEPEGVTSWTLTALDTRPDGSATIAFDVAYTHPSGRIDLTEKRTCEVSAVSADGSYRIDWRSNFKAGAAGATLERTPIGYAGLSLRMAAEPFRISFTSSTEPVPGFVDHRWRPTASAVAANLFDANGDVGGIAMVSGESTAWYINNDPTQQMRWICAAVLAPAPLALAPGDSLNLHYTIAVRRRAWTPEALQEIASFQR